MAGAVWTRCRGSGCLAAAASYPSPCAHGGARGHSAASGAVCRSMTVCRPMKIDGEMTRGLKICHSMETCRSMETYRSMKTCCEMMTHGETQQHYHSLLKSSPVSAWGPDPPGCRYRRTLAGVPASPPVSSHSVIEETMTVPPSYLARRTSASGAGEALDPGHLYS